MNIEKDIFKRASVNYKKIIKYGFKKDKSSYIYEENFLDGDFKAIINIDNNGNVSGKVIDLDALEEYTNFRINVAGEFVNRVKEEYEKVLINIRDNCFENNCYIFSQTNRINSYIKDKYNINPEFLWKKFPGYGVYRNKNNNKWFAVIMNLDFSKLTNKVGEVEIINIKLGAMKVNDLLKREGFYKAYHMNKDDWISITLNDELTDEEIQLLIDQSYDLINEREEWIVSANPNYYDVINCFNDTDVITWKQSSNIHIGDVVYLYVAAPYSKIMYMCKVVEVNIPFEYSDKNITINNLMKIKLLKRFDNDDYNFDYLNKLGIKAIRGPRKISKIISSKII